MTTAAAASIPARAAGPLSRWLSVRHPLHTETAVVLALYGLYEVKLQTAVHVLPRLTSLLAASYVTLHLTVTAAALPREATRSEWVAFATTARRAIRAPSCCPRKYPPVSRRLTSQVNRSGNPRRESR